MKKILIVGLGRSGKGLLEFLSPQFSELWVADDAPFDADELSNKYGTKITAYKPGLPIDLVLPSPGIPPEHPLLKALREEGIPLQSELDFAASFLQGDILAITGTNGKSTTTAWCAHILGIPAAGNIGVSLSSLLHERAHEPRNILEISSFQLALAQTIRPKCAAILNITPDHLLWHGGMEAYIQAKKNIFARMGEGDTLLLGLDSPLLMQAMEEVEGSFHCKYFSTKTPVPQGAFLKGDSLYLREEEDLYLLERSQLSLSGEHNVANALAAASLSYSSGANLEEIRAGLRSFPGLAHRYEVLGYAKGRRFINDSKATNPESTLPALRSAKAPTILLLGGMDKGIDYDLLFQVEEANLKAIVCYGESGRIVYDCAQRYDFAQRYLESDLEAASARAFALSAEGDDIVLSPASASWDAYPSFEVRGDHFREIFRRLSL